MKMKILVDTRKFAILNETTLFLPLPITFLNALFGDVTFLVHSSLIFVANVAKRVVFQWSRRWFAVSTFFCPLSTFFWHFPMRRKPVSKKIALSPTGESLFQKKLSFLRPEKVCFKNFCPFSDRRKLVSKKIALSPTGESLFQKILPFLRLEKVHFENFCPFSDRRKSVFEIFVLSPSKESANHIVCFYFSN
jgi:hypothetical protein